MKLTTSVSFELPRCHSGNFLRSIKIQRSSLHWLVITGSKFKPRPLRQVRQDLDLDISCGLELVEGCLQFRDIVRHFDCQVSMTRQTSVPIPRLVLTPGPTESFLTTLSTDVNGRHVVQKACRRSRPCRFFRFRNFWK